MFFIIAESESRRLHNKFRQLNSRLTNSVQPMRDTQQRPGLELRPDSALQLRVRVDVDVRGGLVKRNDLGLLDERAAEGEELLLAGAVVGAW